MNTRESLVANLQLLGLFVAAQSVQQRFSDPQFQQLDPVQLFDFAVADELSSRNDHRRISLLRRAKLSSTSSNLDELDYRQDRCLERSLIDRLKTCQFIQDNRNLCIFGASGTGKSFLGKAFGVQACKNGYRTRYIKFPVLMRELMRLYKADSKLYEKRLRYYSRFQVLIIDEWLLGANKSGYSQIILELLDERYSETTTIFCTQLAPDGWAVSVDLKALGESIFGRATSNGFLIHLKGDDLRKTYHSKP